VKDPFKKKTRPLAQDAYDELAESYAAIVDEKPHNAYYERPATLSLLLDVNGKRVLDVGCGPGFYAEWLIERGAEVVAFDANEKMFSIAKKRLGERARVELALLEEPLSFASDESFDIVLAPLVLDYVKDWNPIFTEFFRVLKRGGCLVFSSDHPFVKYRTHPEGFDYFETEQLEYVWKGFGSPVAVPYYSRPLGSVINPLINAGFVLERILEPKPTEEFREKSPETYERLLRSPCFMCVRARKPL